MVHQENMVQELNNEFSAHTRAKSFKYLFFTIPFIIGSALMFMSHRHNLLGTIIVAVLSVWLVIFSLVDMSDVYVKTPGMSDMVPALSSLGNLVMLLMQLLVLSGGIWTIWTMAQTIHAYGIYNREVEWTFKEGHLYKDLRLFLFFSTIFFAFSVVLCLLHIPFFLRSFWNLPMRSMVDSAFTLFSWIFSVASLIMSCLVLHNNNMLSRKNLKHPYTKQGNTLVRNKDYQVGATLFPGWPF